MNIIDIARVCHEANRALQIIYGEEPNPPWDQAPSWQRESAIDGVKAALGGTTPQASHENWMEHKTATGWTYGETKDERLKTHPCLVPYDKLPPEQRRKDVLFTGIVGLLSD